VPLRFGIRFREASRARLIRPAVDLALAIGAGRCFVLLIRDGYPVNVLNQIKAVPEVCTIFCATGNDAEVVVATTARGRAIAAVVDGKPPIGIESDVDAADRHRLLRDLGYKL
jgi:adenosine/AMP kinase